MSTWLYQFWLFSFKTAKYWGQGPRFWNADNLGFLDYGPGILNISSLPTTPDMGMRELTDPSTLYNLESGDQITDGGRVIPDPSSLCRWSIHYECDVEYEPLPDSNPESALDAGNDKNWATWPEAWASPPFQDRLVNDLATNDFSNIQANQLPIAVPHIVKAAELSPDEIFKDAFAFSIMSRNETLVIDNLEHIRKSKMDVSELYPLHLATSYLDGARACCNIFSELASRQLSNGNFRERSRLLENEFGHTVLDNLMIAILKAHTSTLPGRVDKSLRNEHRFVGEEVDICGRWDADSECYRSRLAQGKPNIPFSWKHKFCHTSIQTICHCISSGYWSYRGAVLGPSGLFLNHCSSCGLKMQLSPCHTLVMVAYQLSSTGCPDEDLFGIIACFLCLLGHDMDPVTPKEISVQALFHQYAEDQCAHELLTPAELANKVPENLIRPWPEKIKVGWQIFCLLLSLTQESWASYNEESLGGEYLSADHELEEYSSFNFRRYECETCLDGEVSAFPFWSQKKLGILRAAVQAEILTYRRLGPGDPWLSENLNLSTVLEVLENRAPITSIGFISKDLLKPFCYCGCFGSDEAMSAKEVCREYCSNMDDWGRSNFIRYPTD